jgi:hypothetical protein
METNKRPDNFNLGLAIDTKFVETDYVAIRITLLFSTWENARKNMRTAYIDQHTAGCT